VAEDDVDGLGGGDEGEDTHLGTAAGAEHWEHLVDAGEDPERNEPLGAFYVTEKDLRPLLEEGGF